MESAMVRISDDEDCPTHDFDRGEAQGKCWSDGHYLCTVCKHFRADFKTNPDLREILLDGQGGMQFYTFKPAPEF
jgi:hypothetical protein